MRYLLLLLLAISLALCGCDTVSGVSRTAAVHKVPDLAAVKAHIEGYPEVSEVRLWQREGGVPLTLTGIHKADEVYYVSYSGEENIRGTLMFDKNYKGEVEYSQTLMMMNLRPPQAWIDATWPVMKKIEKDLEEHFGLSEFPQTLRVAVIRVENPDRGEPNNSLHSTPR